MKFDSRKRLMELAGVSCDKKEIKEDSPSTGEYSGMEDSVQWNYEVEGFDSILDNAEESDEDVDSVEDINTKNDERFPEKFFKYMYSGERMNESIKYIDFLEDSDSIELPI